MAEGDKVTHTIQIIGFFMNVCILLLLSKNIFLIFFFLTIFLSLWTNRIFFYNNKYYLSCKPKDQFHLTGHDGSYEFMIFTKSTLPLVLSELTNVKHIFMYEILKNKIVIKNSF